MTPASQLSKGNFILYDNKMYLIRNIEKDNNYFYFILKGIYLPSTIINLIALPTVLLEQIHPDCKPYKIIKWKEKDKFIVGETQMIISIPEYVQEISYSLASNQDVYVELCKYEDTYNIFSISFS